jgi:hypothetical protein
MLKQSLFATLSDEQLLAETKRLVAVERQATATLLQSLMEIDGRRLYLREGCASLFTYCTQVLHLAEGSAYNRIEAARAARKYPAVLEAVATGALTLTATRLLAPHLTAGNHRELLEAAQHKSKREIVRLVATLQPKPLAPTVLRRLPQPGACAPERTSPTTAVPVVLPAPANPSPVETKIGASRDVAPDTAERTEPATPSWHSPISPDHGRPVLAPLSASTYRLQVTLSQETHDKLRRAQDLLRHALPTGDVAAILDRALTLLLADLERRRCAAAARPREGGASCASDTRHIPAAVRRAVWHRDQGRCAFVGASGRCRETSFLEFHHVEPYAAGGAATVENIQLRCRAHNLYEATLFFADGSECARERSAVW